MQQSQRRLRHGGPSGPWPFLDLQDEVNDEHLEESCSPSSCEHKQIPGKDCWCKYPQSLYRNWTTSQQKKSRLSEAIMRTHNCTIKYLDVTSDGMFEARKDRVVNRETQDNIWNVIQTGSPPNVRLRMLFVDNCSGPVLQMIGTRYNIEPFYFSSTIGWTPTRFRSNVVNESDHLTVIFTFIRPTRVLTSAAPSLNESYDGASRRSAFNPRPEISIDTQTALHLSSSKVCLVLDRLALHMVRSPTRSTIISLHPPYNHRATTATQLHTRVHLTGKSVYWCKIFNDTSNPTFVFLSYFWYAIYAWDEALEHLFTHISFLESNALQTDELEAPRDLHNIQARLQFYTSLLDDFTKSVKFILGSPNPPLNTNETGTSTRLDELSKELMERECKTLLSEIERLERTRHLMELRLKNVMTLAFGRIQNQDNQQRKKLTHASLNDNAVIKQLTYMTMFFLPASFCANIWSMNLRAINPNGDTSLWEYFAVSLPLIVLSTYIIIAYQLEIKVPYQEVSINETGVEVVNLRRDDLTFWNRVFWPVVLVRWLRFKLKPEMVPSKSLFPPR